MFAHHNNIIKIRQRSLHGFNKITKIHRMYSLQMQNKKKKMNSKH